ncbi:nitrile hydratase subunit alpha [Vibrio sp.]|uniref:nitrile hydratase n=1 Tax=Vibrio viridaestus TaxID=2487322 RepID=A0A3N9U8J5_9VIBR|nr:nitrile hydratase subunit alpha [Vibrio viridaestus]MDC0611746.1 nitrile hydratase subunit alpha [Vibrio sp.]RQW64526.1 nitrile hydratase subunit alpha [Vibrio viridaestus]
MSGTMPPSDYMLRIKAIETLLSEKGLIDSSAVDAMIDLYETKLGPRNGAKVVAKAWSDPEYRKRLLEDGSKAIAELGYSGVQGEEIIVLENTPELHNVIVCTLCSCYPWPVLGLPPNWYKTAAYRSRVVVEPRKVIAEFGLHIDESIEIRVWDSNAEIRYMVLPMQPNESIGLSETELVEWVTRDSMIGTGLPKCPETMVAEEA